MSWGKVIKLVCVRVTVRSRFAETWIWLTSGRALLTNWAETPVAGNNNKKRSHKLGLVVVPPRDPEEEEENIITSVGWQRGMPLFPVLVAMVMRVGDFWLAFPSRQKHYELQSL